MFLVLLVPYRSPLSLSGCRSPISGPSTHIYRLESRDNNHSKHQIYSTLISILYCCKTYRMLRIDSLGAPIYNFRNHFFNTAKNLAMQRRSESYYVVQDSSKCHCQSCTYKTQLASFASRDCIDIIHDIIRRWGCFRIQKEYATVKFLYGSTVLSLNGRWVLQPTGRYRPTYRRICPHLRLSGISITIWRHSVPSGFILYNKSSTSNIDL